MNLTDTEIDAIAERLLKKLECRFGASPVAVAAAPEPIPYKLTVAQFAWCIERSAYFVNEETRINPKLKQHVQGRCPKLIHPAALAFYGVDQAHASRRLQQWPHKSAA